MKSLKSIFSLLLLTLSGTAFSDSKVGNSIEINEQPDFEPLKLKIYDYQSGTYKKLPAQSGYLSLKEIGEKVKLHKNEVIVIYNSNFDRDSSEPRNIQTLGK